MYRVYTRLLPIANGQPSAPVEVFVNDWIPLSLNLTSRTAVPSGPFRPYQTILLSPDAEALLGHVGHDEANSAGRGNVESSPAAGHRRKHSATGEDHGEGEGKDAGGGTSAAGGERLLGGTSSGGERQNSASAGGVQGMKGGDQGGQLSFSHLQSKRSVLLTRPARFPFDPSPTLIRFMEKCNPLKSFQVIIAIHICLLNKPCDACSCTVLMLL